MRTDVEDTQIDNKAEFIKIEPPSQFTKSKPHRTKKTFEEVLTLISKLENVIFGSLSIPTTRKAGIRVPDDIDLMDPYSLFTL